MRFRHFAPALVATALASFAACGGSTERPTPTNRDSLTEFSSAPKEMVSACREKTAIAARCPRVLPVARGWSWRFIDRLGNRTTFTIQSGAEDRDPRRNRPPFFVHVVVDRGALSDLERFSSEAVAVKELGELPSETVSLGRRHWAGRDGELLLLPPYSSASSIHAGHLTFLEDRGSEMDAVSIHAWLPVAETERMLRRIVESGGRT